MTDIKEMVESATAPDTFNLLNFARGRELAEDTVEVYFNENAALKLSDLLKGVNIEAKDFEPTDEMQEQMTALRESKVKFYIRAMSPQAKIKLDEKRDKKLDKAETEAERNTIWADHLREQVSHMLVKSENHEGAVDDKKKSVADTTTLLDIMPPSQVSVFLDAFRKVEFASQAIDANVDAAFLAKA